MKEPWDVPTTEDGRNIVLALLEEYKRAGRDREVGICLARLAHLYKHVGPPDGGHAFQAAARSGSEAVILLRRVGDKKELCKALRAAAVPFVADCEPLLAESLSIAREIGDLEEEAWTTLAMRAFGNGPLLLEERALKLFQQCGSLQGQAYCYRIMGFKIGSHNLEMLQRSIDLFQDAGDSLEAERGRNILTLAIDAGKA